MCENFSRPSRNKLLDPGQLYFFPYGADLNFSFPREAFSRESKCNQFASDAGLVFSAI